MCEAQCSALGANFEHEKVTSVLHYCENEKVVRESGTEGPPVGMGGVSLDLAGFSTLKAPINGSDRASVQCPLTDSDGEIFFYSKCDQNAHAFVQIEQIVTFLHQVPYHPVAQLIIALHYFHHS